MGAILDFLKGAMPQQTAQPTAQATPATQMIGMKPFPTPTQTAAPTDYSSAVSAVQQKYPLLKSVPLTVSKGSGPYYSETYMPWAAENPMKGKVNVQLRNFTPKSEQDLHDSIASESFHYLGAKQPNGQPVNPQWYALKQQFRQTLTPKDLQLAKQHWQEEQKSGEKRSFDDFMDRSYLDMFVRGYIFPQNQGQEWVNRQGKWPPQQAAVLDKMKAMLTSGK